MNGGDEEKATAPKPPRTGRNRSGGGDGNDVSEAPPGEVQDMDETTRAVANQTSDVVWEFMREYNEVQVQRSASESRHASGLFRHSATQTEELLEVESTVPPRNLKVPEFYEIPPPRDQRTIELVHNMRRIAEDMEQTYRPTVTMLVNRWLLDLRSVNGGGALTFDSVWVAFRRVINAVLETGVTWGKLLLLLLFAYEIAVILYAEHVSGFIRQVISSFVRYLIEGPVLKWIADHGGWAAAATSLWLASIRTQIRSAAPFVVWLIGLGALALGAFVFVKRK